MVCYRDVGSRGDENVGNLKTTCVNTYTDRCADICIHMCVDMRADMFADVRSDAA